MAAFHVMISAASVLGYTMRGHHAVASVRGTRATSSVVMEYRLNNFQLPGPLEALNTQILVKLSKMDDRTKGGLFVATEESKKPREGVVVAAGPGRLHPETGKLLPNPVKEGDYVLLADFSGEKVEYCGEQHMFVSSDDVLGVFEDGVTTAKNFRPVSDRLLVEIAQAATETASGIALAVQEDEKPTQGTVVACGEGRLTSQGELQPLPVKKGDNVLYGKYSGTDAELDGKVYKVVFAADCMAKW